MEAKNKAIELVEKFKKHVNGYVGSSMLSNTEYPETILSNAKQCALICVDEIIRELGEISTHKDVNDNMPIGYWQQIKQEIINLQL